MKPKIALLTRINDQKYTVNSEYVNALQNAGADIVLLLPQSKESLEIENLERQVEYEKTMHSIDSTEQMRIIENYESLIQIIQK